MDSTFPCAGSNFRVMCLTILFELSSFLNFPAFSLSMVGKLICGIDLPLSWQYCSYRTSWYFGHLIHMYPGEMHLSMQKVAFTHGFSS